MSILHRSLETDPDNIHAIPGEISLWWLGQSGFLIAMAGKRIVIDPYLSNSLANKYAGTPLPHIRMMPPPVPPEELKEIDWLLLTHGHTDHMDPETIAPLVQTNPKMKILVPRSEHLKAVARGVPENQMILTDVGKGIDLGELTVVPTPAAHEELTKDEAGNHLFLGYVLKCADGTLWHSGDTIDFPGLSDMVSTFDVDLALLPVNGRDEDRAAKGIVGNLTLDEAIALTERIGAKAMIGHHFGMFDFNTIDEKKSQARIMEFDGEIDLNLVFLKVRWKYIKE